MKKLLLVLALLSALFLLCCAQSSIHFPDYSDTALRCRFSLAVDGEPYEIELRRAPLASVPDGSFAEFTDAELTILSPSSLAGLTVRFSGNTAHLVSDEMEIPAERESLGGFLMLLSCFSLRNDEVCQVQTVSQTPSRTAVTYESVYGTYVLIYPDDLTPLSVEFTYRGHLYLLSNLTFSAP